MSKYLPLNLFIRQALLYPLTSPFLPPIAKVEKDYSYAAGKLVGTLEAAPPQGLPKTGQIISYEDYDDGYYKKGYPLTPPRFTDNDDGTITDNATGLMWAKDGNAAGGNNGNPITWPNALTYAHDLTFAEHSDWRLPNINELLSIADYVESYPIIDPIFTNTDTSLHWSSTTYKAYTANAWAYNFAYGDVEKSDKGAEYRIRLVRDA